MLVEVPLGDVVDRITILQIKAEQLTSPDQQSAVARSLSVLGDRWRQSPHPAFNTLPEYPKLQLVNRALWKVEDALREHEAAGDFGAQFVAHARSVYQLNDRRALLKRGINDRLGSKLVEQKSYGTDKAL